VAAVVLAVLAGAPSARAASVDYGPISHKGDKTVGAASTSLKLSLQLGLIANQSGLQGAVKAASNPASGSYGKYLSLSSLAGKYGASSSKRNGVVNAFKAEGITAKVDVTHLRASATVSVGKAQKLFATKWKVYKTSSGAKVALPVDTPKLPSGIKGNVDTVSGMRLQISSGSSSSVSSAAVAAAGGTPTRTGTPAFGCVPSSFPAALASSAGLYPNQILSAYGIAPLQAAGLRGQGARVAILGQAPTPA
jgi:subtilase family serine protease